MKKYLISLEKDSHRRELFFSQPNTADFCLFSAFNTMQIPQEELNQQFDLIKFKHHYQRAVTQGEVGCTLSHLGVYQQISSDNSIADEEYCLICEDDALFTTDFQQHLDKLIHQPISADIVLIGQSKITTFDNIELEINYPITFSFLAKSINQSSFKYAYPYKNYFAGTVAYLIRKSAVAKFINQINHTKPYWLADDFILFASQLKLQIQVVRPLMVIENPALNSNLEAIRGSISHSLLQKLLKYPLKKLLAIKRNLGQ